MNYKECRKCSFLIGAVRGNDRDEDTFWYCRKWKKRLREIKKCDLLPRV